VSERSRALALGLVLCAGLGASVARAAPTLRVGVVPLGGGVAPDERAELTRRLVEALGGVPGLDPLELSTAAPLLGADAVQRLERCGEEPACLRDALGPLRLDLLVVGVVEREPRLTMRLALLDPNSAAAAVRVRVSRELAEPSREVAAAALELFPELARESFGRLVILGTPVGARVQIDGQDRGALALAPLVGEPRLVLTLPRGAHRVEVRAPGHDARVEEVVVPVGGELALDVALEKRRSAGPLYLGAAGLAASGAAGLLGLWVRGIAADWKDACPPGAACAPDFTLQRYRDDEARVDAGGVAASALLGAGLAAVAGAVVWYALDPGEDAETLPGSPPSADAAQPSTAQGARP
jgi:hypothetical protein